MGAAAKNETFLHRAVPYAAGAVLIVAFVMLGFWQLSRAHEKEALEALFAADAPATTLKISVEPPRYAHLEVSGRLQTDRQILIDNIVRDGRVGYYVITPMETSLDNRLLLVNRGWLAKPRNAALPAERLSSSGEWRSLRGRAGQLPRVGIRPGEAFAAATDNWPRTAVYPSLEEVADVLGHELWPFVLLLDADDAEGFLRSWEPQQSGPMTHYGYAFQWFAMALAVLGIAAWQFKNRRRKA